MFLCRTEIDRERLVTTLLTETLKLNPPESITELNFKETARSYYIQCALGVKGHL